MSVPGTRGAAIALALVMVTFGLTTGCATTGSAHYAVAASVSTATPGAYVTALPRGHRPLVVNGVRYAYYSGTFYRATGDRWRIVQAPLGAAVAGLPTQARTVRVKGRRYRLYRGTYYRWNAGAWVVVRP